MSLCPLPTCLGFLDLTSPLYLLLLPLAGLFWWWQRLGANALPARRRLLAIILRTTLFILTVLALSDPRLRTGTRQQAVVWLADASLSVEDRAIIETARFRDQTIEAYGREFATENAFLFTGDQQVLDPSMLETAKAEELEKRDQSDLAAGLYISRGSFPPGYARSIILATDGRSDTDYGPEARACAREGIQVHVVPVSPPENPEILVNRVRAPSEVKQGETFGVTTEISSNAKASATVRVFKNGILTASQQTTLNPGVNSFSFSQEAGEERVVSITVAVESTADTLAQNNRLSALVMNEGQARVLLVSDRPDLARYLVRGLQQEGINMETRPLTGIPAALSDLRNYEALILDNVPATELTGRQLGLISSYVSDFGGGFLMLGGDQSFSLGGFHRTPVADLLPVKVEFEKEREDPSLAMILVIDKSGSMNGEKIEMAKEAARAAIELLTPNDFAGVAVFDNQAFWALEPRQITDKYAVIDLVSTIQAGGGTNMAPAMEMAQRELSRLPAKLKHVIVLTDGQSQPGPFHEITSLMNREMVTVSTVGVGQGADMNLLQDIARWGGGRSYYTDEAGRIPQIFAKETMTASKSALKETPFLPQRVKTGAFLSDIDFDAAPFLYGYVASTVKPGSDLWLVTERGDPLLATWRYGLGTAAAFTSDARNRWAVEWLRWGGFGPFWAQVVRKIARPPAMAPYPLRAERIGQDLVVTLDAVDDLGMLNTDLSVAGAIIDDEGNTREITLSESLPGQFTARIPLGDEADSSGLDIRGNLHLRAVVRENDGTTRQQYAAYSPGYPPEYRLQPTDEKGLQTLAQTTGGLYQPTPEKLAASLRERRALREIRLWPWLIGAALLLFIGDLAAKRWPARN